MNFLFERCDVYHLIVSSVKPRKGIFLIKMLWSIVLNALCKSIKTILVRRLELKLFVPFVIYKNQSVDLDDQFYCPLETQGQRPDLVLWCEERKVIKFVGLTIPWETNIDDAWLQKDSRYGPLVEICEDLGWEAHCLPIEVGARGFVVHRVHSLLRQLGFTSKERKDLIKRMQETVEYFIWLKQDDERWMEK